MTKAEDLAFAGQMILKHIEPGMTETHISQAKGLTKRELFAAMAMQGMLANKRSEEFTETLLTRLAVEYSEALIEALNQTPAEGARDEKQT